MRHLLSILRRALAAYAGRGRVDDDCAHHWHPEPAIIGRPGWACCRCPVTIKASQRPDGGADCMYRPSPLAARGG